jgi:hypothetical protein
MWRHGPGNYTNLCNSCGVKWRRGKILASGEHRHHLCKPLTPPKVKKVSKKPVSSPKKKKLESPAPLKPSNKVNTPAATVQKWVPASSIECPTMMIEEPVEMPIVPLPPAESVLAVPTLDILPELPQLQVININPLKTVDQLTEEFAELLDRLPSHKTTEFTTILAKCFEPKVASAFQLGIQVEMSVLDITEEAWFTLKNLVAGL